MTEYVDVTEEVYTLDRNMDELFDLIIMVDEEVMTKPCMDSPDSVMLYGKQNIPAGKK